jgi:hypothetical protein
MQSTGFCGAIAGTSVALHVALVVLLSVGQARATLEVRDWKSPGDGLITFDTVTFAILGNPLRPQRYPGDAMVVRILDAMYERRLAASEVFDCLLTESADLLKDDQDSAGAVVVQPYGTSDSAARR